MMTVVKRETVIFDANGRRLPEIIVQLTPVFGDERIHFYSDSSKPYAMLEGMEMNIGTQRRYLNLHVHADSKSDLIAMREKKQNFAMTIHRKEMSDGSIFGYLDFHLAADSARYTHEYEIRSGQYYREFLMSDRSVIAVTIPQSPHGHMLVIQPLQSLLALRKRLPLVIQGAQSTAMAHALQSAGVR